MSKRLAAMLFAAVCVTAFAHEDIESNDNNDVSTAMDCGGCSDVADCNETTSAEVNDSDAASNEPEAASEADASDAEVASAEHEASNTEE